MDIQRGHENPDPGGGSGQETIILQVFLHGHHPSISGSKDGPLILGGIPLRVTKEVGDKKRKKEKNQSELRKAKQVEHQAENAEPKMRG